MFTADPRSVGLFLRKQDLCNIFERSTHRVILIKKSSVNWPLLKVNHGEETKKHVEWLSSLRLGEVSSFYCFGNFHYYAKLNMLNIYMGRRGDLMVSALDSGSNDPGSSPAGALCCVLGQYTLLPLCLSPPRCINGYRRIYCWG